MKKFLVAAILFLGLGSKAHAYQLGFDQGYSTWTVVGVTCSSGTATDVTQNIKAFNVGAYRINNEDGSNPVWIGQSLSVSSKTVTGDAITFRGERLASNSNSVWELGHDPSTLAQVRIWCIAADAAGAGGSPLSIATFGYK